MQQQSNYLAAEGSGLLTGLVLTDATSVFRLILTAQQRQHRQLDTRYK